MAPGVRSDGRAGHPGAAAADGRRSHKADARGRCVRSRLRAGTAAGMLANRLLSVALLPLLVRCAVAAEERSTYDASGSSQLQSISPVTGAPTHPLDELSVAEEVPFQVVHSDGDSESGGEGLSGRPAFSSVLTVMAGTVKHPVSLDQSRTLPSVSKDETHTTQWPSHGSSRGSDESSSLLSVGDGFRPSSEPDVDGLTSGTSRPVVLTLPKEKEASLAPSHSDRIILSAEPIEGTSQVSLLTPQMDTTKASAKSTTTNVASTPGHPTTTTPYVKVTRQSATTPQPMPVTRRTTTTTTVRTYTSRRTITSPIQRTSPPRGVTSIFISPFTTTTEAPPPQCNITERLWLKTVVSIYVRRNRLDSIQRQNLRRGLSQGLRKALNDTSAQAQVETVFGSPNMTVAYHVTGGDVVYPPSVVVEGLTSYGRDKLIADLRQYLPLVTALPLPVALWRPCPATGFQLKTVLQFVGAGDDPRSCRFSQMMEQRLERVFSEAQAKVFKAKSQLSVQVLSVSQAAGSPAVSLVYTVKNGSVYLNGTAASNLLGQLSAELVGYFLFYPPLIIAEPLEYHNLNTSVATRDFWVVTVIQDVDNASLEGQYQSFASLMEQRLAELFVLASQQGTRLRRATAVGSFTVQMVSIRRVSGLKNPAEMTYYVQHNGIPLSGTSAAKVLNTVDSQTMALTLAYFVQLQAEPVVKTPPNNLWIIAAVLAPISLVILTIIIITAVLCRKNRKDFKADAIGNLNPRAKMAYRRDVSYYHQPVQGFDYAKQHLGQQGGDEETLPISQDTLVMSLQMRDTSLSLEKALQQDGMTNKRSLTTETHRSKLPSEDGSVISNESEKPNPGRGLSVSKVTAQQKLTKEETRTRDDPYDSSSGSLQLVSIRPVTAQTNGSQLVSSDRSKDSVLANGEVILALKQKSDIEHYRNKLRLKAKKKGYYDFHSTNGSSNGGQALMQKQQNGYEREAGSHGRPLEPDDERGSTYVKSHRRQSQVGQMAYRSRQSLSSPSPGGTEMDLLVMRERPRKGIRNSGYDTEPELIEETNVDHLMGPRRYTFGRGLKGHSETSTLSSQPSIDEVRQQMHLLLEEAFSLASGGQSTTGRHPHHQQHPSDHYSSAPPPLTYSDMVTSVPGTMSSGRGGLQWVPSYGADVYECSLPKPAFRFTQLPEMALASPPPLPPRTGPPPKTSLRRSTSDLGPKGRSSETSVTEMRSQHESNPYGPTVRAALPPIAAEQPVTNYSGNPITAVYAIPATRPGCSEYFVPTSPTSYHSPSWMSYPPEPEDVPPQWADSVPLPGYVEAFPNPRYPKGSPCRLPLQYKQTLEQPPTAPSTASDQSLPQMLKNMDSMPLSSLSTSALVQAIRQEVAKLAKKQNDMFEF
uniref:KIAA1549 n=2 Tax=Nothobranchius TaxID=28779 RepID=A0A1A8V7E8_NOTFU